MQQKVRVWMERLMGEGLAQTPADRRAARGRENERRRIRRGCNTRRMAPCAAHAGEKTRSSLRRLVLRQRRWRCQAAHKVRETIDVGPLIRTGRILNARVLELDPVVLLVRRALTYFVLVIRVCDAHFVQLSNRRETRVALRDHLSIRSVRHAPRW